MRAVVLASGGLDSSLAYALVKEWGAEVLPLHITHTFLSLKDLPDMVNLKTIDGSEELIEIIRRPQYGYGKNLNPCVDCRILMLKIAKQYMEEVGADFVVTGEVLDQRPMSQRLETLMNIDKKAGLEGFVLRPLSGGLLPPTIPEKNNIVHRDQLLSIKGRSRKLTFELAREKKITKFFSPSGGCLLTDPGFCRRLADLMRFQEKMQVDDIEFLKVGRHFRITAGAKLIVGRNKQENEWLEKCVNKSHILLYVPETGSPTALLLGALKFLPTAAAITARYSDRKEKTHIEVVYSANGETKKIEVKPIEDVELVKWRI